MTRTKPKERRIPRQSNSGQIVVEYVLLLMIGVGLAVLITSLVVSRNIEAPGFLIKKWDQIIRTIGADTADDLKPQEQ